MELFIALAVIIALMELKELRQERRMKALRRSVDLMSRKLASVDADRELLQDAKKAADEAREFAVKASGDLATIVNEYKINGIPLGYKRKPVPEQDDANYYVEAL